MSIKYVLTPKGHRLIEQLWEYSDELSLQGNPSFEIMVELWGKPDGVTKKELRMAIPEFYDFRLDDLIRAGLVDEEFK